MLFGTDTTTIGDSSIVWNREAIHRSKTFREALSEFSCIPVNDSGSFNGPELTNQIISKKCSVSKVFPLNITTWIELPDFTANDPFVNAFETLLPIFHVCFDTRCYSQNCKISRKSCRRLELTSPILKRKPMSFFLESWSLACTLMLFVTVKLEIQY